MIFQCLFVCKQTADKKCKQIAENQGVEDSTVAKDFTKNNVFVWKT